MTMQGSGQPLPEKLTSNEPTKLAMKIRCGYYIAGLELPTLAFVSRSIWHVGPAIMEELGVDPSNVLNIGVNKVSDDASLPLAERFTHGQLPTQEDVEGKHVLIINGSSRTGETLQHAADLMEGLGASSIKTAVVFDTGRTRSSGYSPDYRAITDGSFSNIPMPWEHNAQIQLERSFGVPPLIDVQPSLPGF